MADDSARGRFVWHELMTPNSAGAHEFYSKALGWKIEPWEQDLSYSMFAGPSGPLGGSVESREDTPHWVPYVAVTDVDAAARQAIDLGGSVQTAPTAMVNGGRYALLADPQGGVFGIYSSPAELGPETDPDVGEFSWHELATTDNRAAFDFYTALFAWEKVSEFDMGPMGVYLIFGRNGRQMGGIFNKGDMGRPGPAYWVGYVRVKDVQATVNKVQAERGSLVTGPMEVPGGDWIAQLLDPHGALFAVQAMAADVKAAERPMATEAPATERPAGEAAKKLPRSTAKKSAKKKTAKKETAKKETAKKETGKQKAGKQKAAKTKAAKKKSTKKSTKKAAKKAAKKKAAKKPSTSKRAANRKSPRKRAAKKKAGKKQSTGKQATSKKATRKKATRKKATRKQATSKKRTSKKSTSKKGTSKKAASKKAASKNAASKKTASKRAAAGRKKPSKAGKRNPAKRR